METFSESTCVGCGHSIECAVCGEEHTCASVGREGRERDRATARSLISDIRAEWAELRHFVNTVEESLEFWIRTAEEQLRRSQG